MAKWVYRTSGMPLFRALVTDDFCLFFTDMTYVPGQASLPIYVWEHQTINSQGFKDNEAD